MAGVSDDLKRLKEKFETLPAGANHEHDTIGCLEERRVSVGSQRSTWGLASTETIKAY